jgi:hypothetical protein
LRKELTEIVKKEIVDLSNPNAIINDYLFEASFIPYFNNVMLKNELRSVAKDAIHMTIIGELVDDMVKKESNDIAEITIHEAY